MAIIFFGTPDFAVPSLKVLIDEKEDIVLTATQPDRVKGRGHSLSSPPVKELALSHGIRVVQVIVRNLSSLSHTVGYCLKRSWRYLLGDVSMSMHRCCRNTAALRRYSGR